VVRDGSQRPGAAQQRSGVRGQDVADPNADGGFHWQAVGGGTATQTNPLDTSGANGFGNCSVSTSAEDACSLNAGPTRGAEDPRVAAGTLTLGTPTVPWVTWEEETANGKHAIFVARLVGGTHFELFNGGAPISNPRQDATHPDITFLGNPPYVSWSEARDGRLRGFVGHFNAAGVFVQDTANGVRPVGQSHARASLIDARVPISSSCTADPDSGDGSACHVAPVNGPFFLFTTAGSPQRLFAQAIADAVNPALFPTTSVSVTRTGSGAVVSSQLRQDDPVGILVQRIVRFTHVHGHAVPVVAAVGRVPLGLRHRGHTRIHWDLKVNGHKLHRGKYLITLRGFDHHQNLLGTTNPVIFTVR
jgi:hypothetical protein